MRRGTCWMVMAVAALLATMSMAQAQAPSPAGAAHSSAYREDIRIAVSDSLDHFVTDQQTTWRIQARDTLVLLVDSTLRVVRIAIDGRRTTSWGRTGSEVVIPHSHSPGDSMVTRVRFHGAPNGHNWFAIPRDSPDSAELQLAVEVPPGIKPVADGMWNGVLEGVDTLAYDRTSWRFRFDRPVSLSRLRLETTRSRSP